MLSSLDVLLRGRVHSYKVVGDRREIQGTGAWPWTNYEELDQCLQWKEGPWIWGRMRALAGVPSARGNRASVGSREWLQPRAPGRGSLIGDELPSGKGKGEEQGEPTAHGQWNTGDPSWVSTTGHCRDLCEQHDRQCVCGRRGKTITPWTWTRCLLPRPNTAYAKEQDISTRRKVTRDSTRQRGSRCWGNRKWASDRAWGPW